jgi:hypothetical protein
LYSRQTETGQPFLLKIPSIFTTTLLTILRSYAFRKRRREKRGEGKIS